VTQDMYFITAKIRGEELVISARAESIENARKTFAQMSHILYTEDGVFLAEYDFDSVTALSHKEADLELFADGLYKE